MTGKGYIIIGEKQRILEEKQKSLSKEFFMKPFLKIFVTYI